MQMSALPEKSPEVHTPKLRAVDSPAMPLIANFSGIEKVTSIVAVEVAPKVPSAVVAKVLEVDAIMRAKMV